MQHKLLAYSAMAFAVLHQSKTANAGAVYTDIDPDTIIDQHLEYYYMDIDQDLFFDFKFFNVSYTYSDTFYNTTEFRQRIWAGAIGTENAIAGSSQTFVGGGTRYYPYALHVNAPINGALQFNNWINQRMAFRTYSSFYVFSNTYYITNAGGNWYPDKLDHYVGISFIDLDEKLHYGWIRCDVTNEGRILVIKDYAYESKPNTSIKAGDIVGDTTKRSVEINIDDLTAVGLSENYLLNGVTCYTFNSNLYINIDNNNDAYIVKITNLTGATVIENNFKNANTIISLNDLPKGIYIISIVLNNKIYAKEIVVG